MSKKILVLEDDLPSLNLLKDVLEHYGYTVLEAVDGLSAIQIAEKEKPNLAIIDIMLPTLNGYQVCEKLRTIPSLKGMPIIVLTALSEDQHRIRAIEAGATDFLSKPFDRVQLMTKIKAFLALQEEYSRKENLDDVIFSLATALGHRYPAINVRNNRVSYLVKQLGLRMGLQLDDIAEMGKGVFLQDVGLLAMNAENDSDDYVLTDEKHPRLGSDMLAHIDRPIVQAIVRYHHKNLQSENYPHQLDPKIKAIINIVGICNRFDYYFHVEGIRPLTNTLSIMEEESGQGYWDVPTFARFKEMVTAAGFLGTA